MQIIWNVMLYSQHFTCHWKLLVMYVTWLMFSKMADAERSAAVIHTVPDEVPSESRTDETVVSLLDHFRPPAPSRLSGTLPVLKCSAPVFLEAAGYWNKANFMWSSLEFCCMLYTKTSLPEICVAISGDRLIFGVFTVLFVKWSQIFLRFLELFPDM